MPSSYYALWRNKHGVNFWDGPFTNNVNAQSYLDTQVTDKSGGSLVTTSIAMTPGEKREALPILES